MTDNDVSTYNLELVRYATSSDAGTPEQPSVVYMPSNSNEISNQMVIIILAIIIGVVAIAYSRNCNCGK
jgi:hypothetical protein